MSPFGVTLSDPQDDPDPVTCPVCSEDKDPRTRCAHCKETRLVRSR